MRFADFNIIVLILIIAAIYAYWRILGFRDKARQKFADPKLMSELLSQVSDLRQRIKLAVFISALVLCLIGFMRPQWGWKWKEVKRQGLDIFIALDLSKSMLAKDIKPSRLDRAKLAINDFLNQIHSDRIGLIGFAGTAFVQCPLTVDYGGFLLALDSLNPDSLPQGGTAIAAAINQAIESFPKTKNEDKVLILITDGEDHQGQVIEAAKKANKENIIIFAIGVGTQDGDLIEYVDEIGQNQYLKDKQQNVVKTRLNENILSQIALTADGTYVRSSSLEFGLDFLYKEKISKIQKHQIQGKIAKSYQDRFQIFLFLAVILLMVELLISEQKNANLIDLIFFKRN